jgi:hypothetical protein
MGSEFHPLRGGLPSVSRAGIFCSEFGTNLRREISVQPNGCRLWLGHCPQRGDCFIRGPGFATPEVRYVAVDERRRRSSVGFRQNLNRNPPPTSITA